MSAPIELVIFDCDGVLVDSELIGCRIEVEALTSAGLRVTLEEILERFTGVTSKETFRTLEREQGRRLPADFTQRVGAAIRAAFERELVAIAGIHAALAQIEVPVCVASSSSPARIEHSLKVVDLLDRFAPHLFSAHTVGRGKPAPDLFLHAAERMATPPARCLVIEDSIPGVQAGIAAGMRVLGFTGASHCAPGHAERLRTAGAAQTFADMTLLPDLLAAA
ncbi:MAG TPA: HAD family hydrolase [Geminicoccaceae bacterium]|nr:HAD family hydrolase [Geminicoccaceae bacterium]